MRARLLTLRFSPTLGRFDDAELIALQRRVSFEEVREHLVVVGGETMLLCLVSWREQVAANQPEPTASSPAATEPPAAAPSSSGPSRPVPDLRAELDAEQRARFDQIRRWRSQKAHDEGAPPYVILTNRQLVELVRQRPETKAGLLRIDGLGDKKVARYGGELLSLLRIDAGTAEPVAAAATEGASA
jgi:superfamily II DNA helicase RecQ